jgi:hypothetical protein
VVAGFDLSADVGWYSCAIWHGAGDVDLCGCAMWHRPCEVALSWPATWHSCGAHMSDAYYYCVGVLMNEIIRLLLY